MIASYLLLSGISPIYFMAVYRGKTHINTMQMTSCNKTISYNYIDALLSSPETQLYHA